MLTLFEEKDVKWSYAFTPPPPGVFFRIEFQFNFVRFSVGQYIPFLLADSRIPIVFRSQGSSGRTTTR